jgi:hypothetical protein
VVVGGERMGEGGNVVEVREDGKWEGDGLIYQLSRE